MHKFITCLFVVRACICITAFTMLFYSADWGIHERVFLGCALTIVLMFFDGWYFVAGETHRSTLEVLALSFSNAGNQEGLNSAMVSYIRRREFENSSDLPLLAIMPLGQYIAYGLLAWGLHALLT
ncbi:hypothetical protein SB725_17310 [Pseudomonas sp. SIMBA_041]|uniref:hypothetical protein n=1 Tax=Pseudomonas sp. SIMBA_041 TaxID=3085782 RepID=UPI00397BB71E